ncbi:MAG: hypothetical protein ACRBEE_07490 [Arenicella sp.]
MKLSTRLLITFIFCALVLPFIVKHFGLNDLRQQKKIEQTYSEEAERINTNVKSYKAQLLKSVEDMNFLDKNLHQCVVNNISKYFGLSDSSNHLQSAADLTALDCHRQNITSLEGIDGLSKLEAISLTGNDIRDASPLARLDSLKKINLSYGNKEIENVEYLSNLNNLIDITFPDLNKSFCYQAQSVVANMKSQTDEEIKHNANKISCRGKKTNFVTKALDKRSKSKTLTEKEEQAISDYEENESWSN